MFQGAQSLRSNGNILDAVVEAVVILEDSPMTNAGFGSNLTLNGTVECDASVMDGSNLQYGAVGAVSGIKNPVLLAKRLCEQQSIKFAYGRIPPRCYSNFKIFTIVVLRSLVLIFILY